MKKKLALFAVIIILVGGFSIYYAFFRESGTAPELVTVKKGSIIQEVSVTGIVKPVESVDLAFERVGEISGVGVTVGDRVASGQFLIQQDVSELSSQLAEARATINAQKAKLDELKRGARPEDVAVKQTEFQKAGQDLANYYSGLYDVFVDAYAKAEDAIRVKTSGMFSGYKTSGYRLTFNSCDVQSESEATNLRLTSDIELDNWQIELLALNTLSSFSNLDTAMQKAKEHLIIFRNFLDRANTLLVVGCTINNPSLDSYRTNIGIAKANVLASLMSINSQEQKIAAQKLTVQKIKDELNLKVAGPTNEELANQIALVSQAEARLQTIQIQIEKSSLISPIDGVVAKVDVKIGEVVQSGKVIVSIISQDRLEVEANIPEADIAKIRIGNTAQVTLDAFGQDVIFRAKVVSIEPAETMIEGVATYKTKLIFIKEDERIKSGMTANVDILAGRYDNVLVVPQRAVVSKEGGKFIRVMQRDGSIKEIGVEIGLKGSDGNIEIRNGVREGDKVVMSLSEK